MCAQPRGSSVSMMKSSRLRLELGATQAIPRLQMSPMCIGVVVIWVVVHVALAGLKLRFRDCPAFRLMANAKYGLPSLSSVNATNGVEASWPNPASKACCGVHVLPLSSEYDTHSV